MYKIPCKRLSYAARNYMFKVSNRNTFKVSNKDTRTTPMASFWYLYCYQQKNETVLLNLFEVDNKDTRSLSSICTVDIENLPNTVVKSLKQVFCKIEIHSWTALP